MRAHVMNGDVIVNTIVVDSLDVIPNLIDAAIGGKIGDSIENGVVVPAQVPVRTKADIQGEIDAIERATLANRGGRELDMRAMEKEAAAWSADSNHAQFGVPVATILAGVPYYVKAKRVDDQIATLRTEFASAP